MSWLTNLISPASQPNEVSQPKRAPRAAAMVESLEHREMLSGSTHSSATFSNASEDQYTGPFSVSLARDGNSHVQPAAVSAPSKKTTRVAASTGGWIEGQYNLREQTFTRSTLSNAPADQAARALATNATHSYAGRPPKPQADRPSPRPEKGGSHPRVLLIEDDRVARTALASILKHRGFHVTAVATLAEGMDELATDPDRVIVDLSLPDGDGEAILRQARSAHLHSRITVMTGVDDPTRLNRVRDLGAENVLQKPVDIATLLHGLGARPQN